MRKIYLKTLYIPCLQDLQKHNIPKLSSLLVQILRLGSGGKKDILEWRDMYGAWGKPYYEQVSLLLLFFPIVHFHTTRGDFVRYCITTLSRSYAFSGFHSYLEKNPNSVPSPFRCHLTNLTSITSLSSADTTLYLIPKLFHIWAPLYSSALSALPQIFVWP